MEIVSRMLYYIFQNATWMFVFVTIFEKSHKIKIFQKLTQIIVLVCVQEVCRLLVKPIIVQLIMILAFCAISQMEWRRPFKSIVVEIIFSYAIKELLRMMCSLASTFFCILFFGVNSWAAIVAVCGVLLLLTCWIAFNAFKNLDLSGLGEKYSVGLLALVFILMFATLGKIQLPYSKTSREYFLFVFFVMTICFIMLLVWTKSEHKNMREKERLGQSLEQAAHERDDLLTANHRLGKTLPELEHKYDKLAEKVRRMETLPHKEEFAAELDALSSVRCRVVQQTERVDTDTGVPGLNGSVEYVAHIAEERGVLFGCRILAGLDKLSDYPGITEQSLRQLLRNLLDNAIHAAARAERSPKMVQCMMGVAGNCYQIDVYDSGDPFQSHILENLGRMGNTTDGNGVGLPDVLDISARCGASIFVTHFDEVMATGATKRVTIRFDGEAMAHLSAPGLGETMEISMGALLRHGGYHEKGENRVCTKS